MYMANLKLDGGKLEYPWAGIVQTICTAVHGRGCILPQDSSGQ